MTLDDSQPLTPAQAAEWLGLKGLGFDKPDETICRMAKDGRIGHIRIAGRMAFLKEQLVEYARREVVGNRPRKPSRFTKTEANVQ